MKNVFRTCAVGVGIAAMLTVSTLNASMFSSERVSIPFAFHVSNIALPAGDYQIDVSSGGTVAFLRNVKTGEQVQVLLSGNRSTGHFRLVFENANGSRRLKTIS
jgi:hypothetical protein